MEKMRVWVKRMYVVIGILLIIAVIMYGPGQSSKRAMDAREVHYDADNYLLLINQSKDLAGFYYVAHPLTHMQIKVNAPEGVYDAYFKDGYMFLEDTKQDATIQIKLRKRQAEWIEKNYEDGFPALVYREK